jgi:hypothetical protein
MHDRSYLCCVMTSKRSPDERSDIRGQARDTNPDVASLIRASASVP